MDNLKDAIAEAKKAIDKRNINWLVDKLISLNKEIIERDYLRIVILTELEDSGLWKEHAKFSSVPWVAFLKKMWPGISNEKFQHCKSLMVKFGHKLYRAYGHDRLTVVARYGGFEDKVISWMDDYSVQRGQIPSVTTIAKYGNLVTGKAFPKVARTIISGSNWKEMYTKANLELKKAQAENARLREENASLRLKLRSFFQKELEAIRP